MTIFEIGRGGLVPLSAEGKNDLERGRILHLNGYNDPEYLVVANLGINPNYPEHGASYRTLDVETLTYSQHDAYSLKWLKDKTDNRIQPYITDRIIPESEVADLEVRADEKTAKHEATQARKAAEREIITAKGKVLFERHIPSTAKALIIAECHKDESDLQSDYYGHATTETIILASSPHTKDLFAEMRKAAAKIPETEHLGPGKGHFEPHVLIGTDIRSNGSAYWKGSVSHWHRELTEDGKGNRIFFQTLREAERYTQEKGDPYPIGFDGIEIPFYWDIHESDLEHRQKYSMGAGYYLKDGHSDSSGWSVKKIKKYGNWEDGLFFAMGRRCIWEREASHDRTNP